MVTEPMPGLGHSEKYLDARSGQILCLAFFCLLLLARLCHADTYSPDERQRLHDAENYLRKNIFHGFSILPQEVRSAASWFSGSWHSVPVLQASPDAAPGLLAAPVPAAAAAPQEASFMDDLPVNMGSSFHHKGFLPTHDAMVMGMALNKKFADDKLEMTLRPFYGQNYLALQGYWGMETALDIAQKSDGIPWGKIALGYTDGNSDLTDHGRGLNLHGDVDLTQGFKLTAGMRQSDLTSSDNYVLLRWSLALY